MYLSSTLSHTTVQDHTKYGIKLIKISSIKLYIMDFNAKFFQVEVLQIHQ